jgi:hypothetical protein
MGTSLFLLCTVMMCININWTHKILHYIYKILVAGEMEKVENEEDFNSLFITFMIAIMI